jgi:hypothetical protein
LKIKPDGSVFYRWIVRNIGSHSAENLEKDFADLVSEIDKNELEKAVRKKNPGAIFNSKKLRVSDGSLNSEWCLTFPCLSSTFLFEPGEFKIDKAGNIYMTTKVRPFETNGTINKVSEDCYSISWPPGTKEIYVAIDHFSNGKPKDFRSFSNMFYKKYGRSKTVRY